MKNKPLYPLDPERPDEKDAAPGEFMSPFPDRIDPNEVSINESEANSPEVEALHKDLYASPASLDEIEGEAENSHSSPDRFEEKKWDGPVKE